MSDKFLIAKTENACDLPLPKYMTAGAAGMDLYANVIGSEVLSPGEIKKIPTGIMISLPVGYEAQIRPRSGLAQRGVTLVNAPGTVDSDYRGEIQAILINLGRESFTIERGMRIAQMIIAKVEMIEFSETVPESLSKTLRGAGGFGHTGK